MSLTRSPAYYYSRVETFALSLLLQTLNWRIILDKPDPLVFIFILKTKRVKKFTEFKSY